MNKRMVIILGVFLLFTLVFAGCGKRKEEQVPESLPEEVSKEEPEPEEAVEEEPEEPELTSEELAEIEKEEKREKIRNISLSISFGDSREILDGETVNGWLEEEPDGTYGIREEDVREYVNGLSKKYDTFGISRKFRTHNGDTVTVTGGDYGWWMNRPETTQQLCERILSGESGEFEPVYYGTGLYWGENDIGNTYVEINTREQHLYVWKDGSRVYDSDFVSGGLMKGNSTPDGTYAITYKERDATLVGENYSSAVKYWMPFNGNIGMHDAPWRDAFGGHIYYMNGSHGCVNLPTKAAADIYEIVTKGEPVVVYGGISKEDAVASMTAEEKEQAMRKGYVEMSPEFAEKIALEQLMAAQQQALALQAAEEAAQAASQQQPPAESSE
ncbi:MAG: L,D-transpeptidase/peptidoglycan binding protein [Lachnospiraceae bacterium]|nr:L,D-transpeptidase/peptidoglycan binding protein [Lachnospiraceae bacterium]